MTKRSACLFYTVSEVAAKRPFSAMSQLRLEQAGRFPKRIVITQRKLVWRKAEIDQWERDPENWRAPAAEVAA